MSLNGKSGHGQLYLHRPPPLVNSYPNFWGIDEFEVDVKKKVCKDQEMKQSEPKSTLKTKTGNN